jgi:hypothetical protein
MAKPTPAELRQKAKQEGWSEDFERFDDATLKRWLDNYWDEKTGHFKSEKVDAAGNPIQGTFEKPDECPPGMTAFGKDQCRPLSEVQQIQARQAGQAQPAAPPPPPKPVTEGKAGELTYTGNPLTDTLIEMFNTRRRISDQAAPNLFGFQGGRDPGQLATTAAGAPKDPLGAMPDVTGRLLQGGGLYWTGAQPTAPAAAPTAAPAAPAPAAPAPAPQPGASAPAPTQTAAPAPTPTAPAPTPQTARKVSQPTARQPNIFAPDQQLPMSPLAGMLTQRKRQGAFGGMNLFGA